MTEEYTPHVPQASIQDLGDGCYNLLVDDTVLVSVVNHQSRRVVRWQIYGPLELNVATALMTEFAHLVMLINGDITPSNEPRRKSAQSSPAVAPAKGSTKRFIRKRLTFNRN